MSLLQVLHVGSAESAAYLLQMKLNVVVLFGVERAEQKATELRAGWATESMASPNLSYPMHSRLALHSKRQQALAQRTVAAQALFDRRHTRRRERFVQIGLQLLIGEKLRHTASISKLCRLRLYLLIVNLAASLRCEAMQKCRI